MTPLGTDPARLELGQMAARMWTSFVTHLNPNRHGRRLKANCIDSLTTLFMEIRH
jgi:hypothetical protein